MEIRCCHQIISFQFVYVYVDFPCPTLADGASLHRSAARTCSTRTLPSSIVICAFVYLLLAYLLIVCIFQCYVVLIVICAWGGSLSSSLELKRPKPVVSGWVVGGYLSFPLRKQCGNADKQQSKHMLPCEGQNSDPN